MLVTITDGNQNNQTDMKNKITNLRVMITKLTLINWKTDVFHNVTQIVCPILFLLKLFPFL